MKKSIDDDLTGAIFSTRHSEIIKSDYAVVLGCAPEQAIKRAEYALHFYERGGTQKIIASGGVKHEYRGEKLSESLIMRSWLLEHGVPESAVIVEESAEDTVQNMVCSLAVMCKSGDICDVKNITVITDPFHMLRSLLLAKIYLPDYFIIHGYGEGWEEQRELARHDGEFRKTLKNELELTRAFLRVGASGCEKRVKL